MNRVPLSETLTYLTALALIAVITCATIKVTEERQGLNDYHERVVAAGLKVLPEFRGKP